MAEYQVATAADKRQLTEFLMREGQFLLPMVKLIEQSELAIDQLIDVLGRASIEAVLELSARETAGAKSPGKASGDVRWHGRQDGVVHLAERKLHVSKPRLRHKTEGEVQVPAYEALRTRGKLAGRMMDILLHGVSTRRYDKVLPAMAETVGVSKSAVSRANVEAGTRLLAELAEKRFDGLDILVIYIDGIRLGAHHVLGAIGVDSAGNKHVLGLREGSSENATTVSELLNDLVSKGVGPGRRRLFVIDGAKALRAAIDRVYGDANPVQRCRNHKVRNVCDHLPKDQHANAKATLRAAWKLDAAEGVPEEPLDIEQVDFYTDRRHLPALLARENGICFYCLRHVRGDNCQLDHVVAQADGANHSYRNVVVSCHECNTTKQAKHAGDFIRSLYRRGVLSQSELEERLLAVEMLQSGKLVPDIVMAPTAGNQA